MSESEQSPEINKVLELEMQIPKNVERIVLEHLHVCKNPLIKRLSDVRVNFSAKKENKIILVKLN